MQNSGRKSPTNWVGLLVAVLGIALSGAWYIFPTPCAAQSAASDVTWLSNLKSAEALSARTDRPMLVDFSATWCGPCQAMIHDTFPDLAVSPLLKNVVCVRIDVDADQSDAVQYQISAIPRIFLFAPGADTSPKMDVTGYEDPDTFANSLRSGLGMPQLPSSASPGPAMNTAADTVAQALETNAYAKLKAGNKSVAAQGLRDLVAELGEPAADRVEPVDADLIGRAGSDANVALIAGMASPYLADRVGAYSAYLHIHSPQHNLPSFDPWAPKPTRLKQLGKFAKG